MPPINPLLALGAIIFAARAVCVPPPPAPEPIEVVELPLPPVAPSNDTGACTEAINPHRTGCISQAWINFQAGDFTPDGKNVVANVDMVGAPASPDPASIYIGQQVILVKADGTNFSNGEPWKCLSCAVAPENAQNLDPQKDYPHVFRGGDKVLWGHNVVDCDGVDVQSDECTPEKTHIYPIYWNINANGSGPAGAPREMRLHPDDEHIGWSSFTNDGGQNAYFGRLEFNPNPTTGDILSPRYDLANVTLLHPANGLPFITANGTELELHHDAITVGELRGFSGAGDEILYIGNAWESDNIDLFAVHTVTGAVRRLTEHPEYADPIAFSHDNQWFVTMDTRGSNRTMWMSGMRWVPPLNDIVATVVASSTRNNGPRRFFQPILIDRYGDRGDYFGQQVNAEGDGSDGSVNDPNWNGRADPAFSPDGTAITYWQALVVSPSCGGENPLPCPVSTAQGGRGYRIMLARLTGRQPTPAAPVFDVPEYIPWAIPFPPGSSFPAPHVLQPGNYTLKGQISGVADVSLIEDSTTGSIGTVAVNYTDYSDKEGYVINGHERVAITVLLPNFWDDLTDWESDMVETGVVLATKKTTPGGFHLEINALTNIFNASGNLTTTIDGVVYVQPTNGA